MGIPVEIEAIVEVVRPVAHLATSDDLLSGG